MLRFSIYQDRDNEWRWSLWSENGRRIAASVEGFRERTDCLHAILVIKQEVHGALVVDAGNVPPSGLRKLG